MPVMSPRDFESWMRWVERRLNMVATQGRGALVTRIEQVESDAAEGQADTRTPAAPTVVNYATGLYVDDAGVTRGRVVVTFNPVTLATDGTGISVDRYEIWGRPGGEGTTWVLVATSGVNAMTIEGFHPGAVWLFQVRAIGRTSVTPGAFSPETSVTVVQDVTPPPQPSRPKVSVVQGVFRVEWDGLDSAGEAMPPDLAYVEVAIGDTAAPTALTGRRLRGAGLETFVGFGYGQTRYFRLRAVDSSGNASPWSGNGSGTATPLVDIGNVSIDETLAEQMAIAQDSAIVAETARALASSTRADADAAALAADQAQASADDAHEEYLVTKADRDEAMLTEADKATIVYAGVAPTGDETVLWIDTAESVAMVWDGLDWVALDDPAVDAALADVLEAQSDWNEAQARADAAAQAATAADVEADAAAITADTEEQEALDALEAATAAYNSASGKNRLTYAITDPDPAYAGAAGDTWFRRDATGTVIAQWEWTGSAWSQVRVGSTVIANLDVGKLTAGAGSIDTLVAQQFAADTGEFLTARAEWFEANKIVGDWIEAGAVQAQHIGVGEVQPEALAFGVDELAPNPMWNDTAMRIIFPATGMAYANTAGLLQRGQTHVLSVPFGAVRTTPFSLPMPVSPGEKFYLRQEARHSGADWFVTVGLETFTVTGVSQGVVGIASDQTDLANVYVPYEGVVQAPDGAVSARLVVRTTVGTAGTWTLSAVSWRRVMASTGAGGQRLEISPAAIRLWGLADDGQASIEIGTSGAEVITLRDPVTDTSVTVLDNAGNVSAKALHAADGITLRGQDIADAIRTAGFVVARADVDRFRDTSGNLSTETDLIEVQFTTPPGNRREYRVQCDNFGIGASYRESNFLLRYTTDGSPVTNSSTEMLRDLVEPSSYHKTKSFGREFSWLPGLTVRVRASIVPGGGGSGNIQWNRYPGCSLSIIDEGKYAGRTGGYASSGTVTPVIATHTSAQTGRKWDQSYRGDGSQYTYDASKNYQGYYLSSNGVLKSAIGAPDQMFTDLAGSSVNWIRVYLFADHWYSASGGQARIGVHGAINKPATFPGIVQDYAVNFARDQGIWVTLPSDWNEAFKSGAFRGITLHANGSTSSTHYGYFAAAQTLWQWEYVK